MKGLLLPYWSKSAGVGQPQLCPVNWMNHNINYIMGRVTSALGPPGQAGHVPPAGLPSTHSTRQGTHHIRYPWKLLILSSLLLFLNFNWNPRSQWGSSEHLFIHAPTNPPPPPFQSTLSGGFNLTWLNVLHTPVLNIQTLHRVRKASLTFQSLFST